MLIQVRFEDGSTEERDAESPCIADVFEPALRHPSEERRYLYFRDDPYPLSFCACAVRPLKHWRGGALVWRITGGLGEDETMTGEWAPCRVETADEQIDRLTRERDEARRAYALSLTSLRNPADFEEWKRLRAKASKEGWLP